MSRFHDSTKEELRLLSEEFKWRSIFQIHRVKPMKLERFQFHLYEQLIGLCLVASITYRMRQLIWEKKQKEISEYKGVYIIQIHVLNYDQDSSLMAWAR